ncbi:MAG TPA: cysteine rich repeat-containing protein [Bradyrhizobium sp.]|nr:cysteine rich repeat-containing protein [Bradyrhizobium sp.]
MTRFLFAIALVLITASSASAQQRPGQDACGRDASRFCRAHLNDGDQVVLACLQQHRAKLTKACQATLAANGR